MVSIKAWAAAVSAAVPLLCAVAAAHKENATQEIPYIRDFFYAGGEYILDGAGGHIYHNQMYVEYLRPQRGPTRDCPIVMIHGQAQTGTIQNFLNKPDGGRGWASYFISLLTTDASYHAPYDYCTFDYYVQAGCSRAEHLRLPDVGVFGNGHMVFMEKNSDVVAGLLVEWIEKI